MIVGILVASLPGMIWLAANAIFLGCRDFKTQFAVAGIGLFAAKLIGIGIAITRDLGVFGNVFGSGAPLAYELIKNVSVLIVLGVLAWLASRQSVVADYRKNTDTVLKWGLTPAILILAFNIVLLPQIADHIPYFAQIWGRKI